VSLASPVGGWEDVQLVEQRRSCWQVEIGEVDLVTLDGGYDAVDKTKRAFCPVDHYPKTIQSKLDGLQRRLVYVFNDSTARVTIQAGGTFQADDSCATVVDYATRNLTQRVESIAAALTNYGLATTNDTVQGDAFAEESYVHVRWQWLILPAFLELASLVLLVLTIVHSRREDVPIWKSSVLALMYHGVDELHDRVTLASERLSSMELIAKGADVQLVKNEDGVNSLARRSGNVAVTEDK
jgi:hypothetical protein